MLNRSNITSSLITSASATNLPDGLYNVAISYQDRFSHQAAVTTLTNVLFDAVTQQPSIISPSSFSPLADDSDPVATDRERSAATVLVATP